MPDAYEEDNLLGKSSKDQRLQLLSQRYQEEKGQLNEQDQWERDQQRKTAMGWTQNKRPKNDPATQKKYDLLLDNQVDFVQSSILDGLISSLKQKGKKQLKD